MDDLYAAYCGLGPHKIPHNEYWSCPDAETYLTGIDYYEHPKLCREKVRELYPVLRLPVPENDTPIPRPTLDGDAESSHTDEQGRASIRWGTGESFLR